MTPEQMTDLAARLRVREGAATELGLVETAKDISAAADLIDSMAQRELVECTTCGAEVVRVPGKYDRVPLTDEQIDELWQEWLTVKYGAVTKDEGRIFARLVEAAHGIRSEK